MFKPARPHIPNTNTPLRLLTVQSDLMFNNIPLKALPFPQSNCYSSRFTLSDTLPQGEGCSSVITAYKETECALLIKQMINFPHPFHSTFLPSSSARGPWVQIQPTILAQLCNSAYRQKTSNPGWGEQIRIDFWKCKRHNLVWTVMKRDCLEFRS